jgi:hypothetical protein
LVQPGFGSKGGGRVSRFQSGLRPVPLQDIRCEDAAEVEAEVEAEEVEADAEAKGEIEGASVLWLCQQRENIVLHSCSEVSSLDEVKVQLGTRVCGDSSCSCRRSTMRGVDWSIARICHNTA